MTPQEKKEFEFIVKSAIKVAIGIAVLFLILLIATNL